MHIKRFLKSVYNNSYCSWSSEFLLEISEKNVPDLVLGNNLSILKSDIHSKWARWFIESMCDPKMFEKDPPTYSKVFSVVYSNICSILPEREQSHKVSLSGTISDVVLNYLYIAQNKRIRKQLTLNEKLSLIDISGRNPRCWICGYKFSDEAIENFISRTKYKIPRPLFIDILKPLGLSDRDLQIEVDHIKPFSHGWGDEDNLRISCGWCNRYKSNCESIYDTYGLAKTIRGYNNLPFWTLPNPFWTIRVLGVNKKCSFNKGCNATNLNSELTIAPIVKYGSLNPANLRVVCYEHDPLVECRLLKKDRAALFWR